MLYNDKDKTRRLGIDNHGTSADGDGMYRTPFRRDYSRLIHSPAFRRLQGKTQLYPGHESDFFRNRLTHSLEVAQIAKSIAAKINTSVDEFKENNIDLDLVELAGLAHDLGHPPFGHNGEKALDDCMKSYGGFEGNAQTLRILAVTEKKETKDNSSYGINENGVDLRLGLNLTYRSMAAILKYDSEIPKKRKKNSKLHKGFYASEKKLVEEIKKHVCCIEKNFKTIECQIMDIADDIAYSTYDLEDGLKGGFTSPLSIASALMHNAEVRRHVFEHVAESFKKNSAIWKEANEPDSHIVGITDDSICRAVFELLGFESIMGFLMGDDPTSPHGKPINPLSIYQASNNIADCGYFRSNLTSGLVNRFVEGVKVFPNKENLAMSKVFLRRQELLGVESLKHLNYAMMIMSPRLKLVEYRGYEIIERIFRALTTDDGHLLLPADWREIHSRLKLKEEKMRAICDFISGMTDRYAIEFYGRLVQGDQSIFKPF